jgi:peroxiredoxin
VVLDPGSPFPAIDLRDESGRMNTPSGGETLYSFFKTTCPTSAFAWPYLQRIWKSGRGGSFFVLAVSQDDPETTARFYEELGLEIPTVYDPEPWRASDALGLTTIPAFLLVDSKGVLRDYAIGFQKHKMEEFAARAARLGGGKAAALFSPEEQVPAIKPG